jgi:hypothetical protein
MKYQFLLLLLNLSLFSLANDGAYYGSGNHLIPIFETEISVKKEILSIKRNGSKMEVTVYYEFFNPSKDKEILVGFEAFSPEGDVDGTPKNSQHPYMYDFTVNLNDQILPHQVSIIEDSIQLDNDQIKSIHIENNDNEYDIPFYYVYHFKAKFKSGLNIVKHTYSYQVSTGVAYEYNFNYILTAANRWANKQIDDFTLVVDMGDFSEFHIENTFFNDTKNWISNGIGKIVNQSEKSPYFEEPNHTFYNQKGNFIYQEKNFHPKGELNLYSINYYPINHLVSNLYIPFKLGQANFILDSEFNVSKNTLRNLPFARRGYIFKNEEIQSFYEKMEWYIPNPNYTPKITELTEDEKEWIKRLTH